MRIENWTKKTPESLIRELKTILNLDETGIIPILIWQGNRVVKEKAPSTKRKFYSLKNEFIVQYNRFSEGGRVVREEVRECYGCWGSGIDEWGTSCERCDGTGVYMSRTLFVHYFNIDGQKYTFHSYNQPTRLLPGKGDDLDSYGGKFTCQELDQMHLPMSGILKVLGWIAAARWSMNFDRSSGEYKQWIKR